MKCAPIIGTVFLEDIQLVCEHLLTSAWMIYVVWLYVFFTSPGNIFMTSGNCDTVATDAGKLTRTVADEKLIYFLGAAFFLWLFSPCCRFYLGVFFAVHKEQYLFIVHHGLINYIDTKAKCRHLKNLTCKRTLRQVFIRDYRLELYSIMLVFSTHLCELPSPFLSGSTLPPSPPLPCVNRYTVYTRVRGGGGIGFQASDR